MAKTRQELYMDSRYRCCCRMCHSTSGSALIGAIQMFAIVGYLLHLSMGTGPPRAYFDITAQVAGVIVAVIVVIFIVLLHVYGVYFRRPLCIIPFMVMQLLCMVALLVFTLVLAVQLGAHVDPMVTPKPMDSESSTLASPDSSTFIRSGRTNEFYWKIGLLAVLVVGAFIHLWFFVVVLTAYRYVRTILATPKNPLAQYRIEPHDL